MSQSYTLAGPDYGVRRVDFAELCNQVGDDAAIDAANATSNGVVFRVPNTDPIRLVRSYKDGDETLGYQYFARRAGVPKDERAAPAEEPDTDHPQHRDVTGRRHPLDERHFGVPAQHLGNMAVDDPAALNMMDASVRFTISIPLKLYVRAKDEGDAAEVLKRYVAGDVFDPDTGIMSDPARILAVALQLVKDKDNLAEAGWEAELIEARPTPIPIAQQLVRQLIAEELRRFQTDVASNVDMLAALMDGR